MKKLFLLAMVGLLFAACERPEQGQNIIRNAVKDADGNKYDAVKIGNQVWMASNLKAEHYADGSEIPMGGNTSSETEPYRYYPDGKFENVNYYGYLYNWPAVMHGASSSENNPSGVQGICPNGWHVPSDAEWDELEDYVENHPEQYGNSVAKALASNNGCWIAEEQEGFPGFDQSSNNTTGFSAVPAGYCYFGGHSSEFGNGALFWSSTQNGGRDAWYRALCSNDFRVFRDNDTESDGYSVRCVRD